MTNLYDTCNNISSHLYTKIDLIVQQPERNSKVAPTTVLGMTNDSQELFGPLPGRKHHADQELKV